MTKVHELKTWPELFEAVVHPDPDQRKTVEIRKEDRNFEVGDLLILMEYDPNRLDYTDRVAARKITHILRGEIWLQPGYVALSMVPIEQAIEPVPYPLEFVYTNWQGKSGTRRAMPFRIHFGQTPYHPEAQWLLSAYDLDKRAPRDFALRDISSFIPYTRNHGD